jgi:LPXTG-motif cell wall-anchored protein
VGVTFNSTPVALGTLVAGPNGVVSGQFNVPTGVGLGSHTVQLTGTSGGASMVMTAAIEVVAAGTAPAPAPTNSSGALPVTGSSTFGYYSAAGVGLIFVGAAVIGLSRRRDSQWLRR